MRHLRVGPRNENGVAVLRAAGRCRDEAASGDDAVERTAIDDQILMMGSWNSEAGRVRGVIKKKLTAATKLKGYIVRASKEEPQYVIESDKTDHVAVHKGSALRKLRRASAVRGSHQKH